MNIREKFTNLKKKLNERRALSQAKKLQKLREERIKMQAEAKRMRLMEKELREIERYERRIKKAKEYEKNRKLAKIKKLASLARKHVGGIQTKAPSWANVGDVAPFGLGKKKKRW